MLPIPPKPFRNLGQFSANALFSVHKDGTDQTGIVNNTWTKITWAAELFDTTGELDLTDNQFEATWNGYLFININVLFSGGVVDDKQIQVAPRKDGATMDYISYGQTNGLTQAGHQGSFIIPIVSGSAYSIYTRHTFGVDGTVSGNLRNTFMQGVRIG